MAKLTQAKLERDGIAVGDYYVIRRGTKLAIFEPGEDNRERYNYATSKNEIAPIPPGLVTVISKTQIMEAVRVAGSNKRLNEIEDEIGKLEDKIAQLTSELRDLEEGIEVAGYDVTAAENGIDFGCTYVEKGEIKAILKMMGMKEGKK